MEILLLYDMEKRIDALIDFNLTEAKNANRQNIDR